MNYVIWDFDPGDKVCTLEALQNVDKDFQLSRGISRIENWPENACYFMDKTTKKEARIEDCLQSIGSLLVISSKIKNLLEPKKLKNNEFLPVTIYNHKDRPIKEPFFILHQIVLQDCINTDKSVFEIDDLNPELFWEVKNLVIDEKKIDPDVFLFRMKHYPFIAMIHRDVADIILKAGVTGIAFQEIEDFSDLD